jgi:tetratricopeptide (TPR) repeat protein
MTSPFQTLLQDGMRKHQQGRLVEAERLYRSALKREPTNFGALHCLSMLLLEQGKPHEAAEFANAAVKRNPASCEALMLLGSSLLKLARVDEAVDCFRRTVRAQPDNTNARFNMAIALAEAGRFSESLGEYDKVVAAKPRDAIAWNNRGAVLAQLKRPADAVASFDRALALMPGYPDALNNRGNALAILGRHDEALQSFNRLLSLQPNRVDAISNRAIALNALGRVDEALAACDRALSIQPDHVGTLVTHGNILHSMERPGEAIDSYERALALKPRGADIIANRSLCLVELGLFDEALADAERATAIDPVNPRAYVARGRAFESLARYAEAIPDYQAALKLKPDETEAAFNLRVVYLRLGRFKEGWLSYEPRLHRYPQPRWDGSRVQGTLLIWCDEGVGDQIVYSSALPDLSDRADRVVIEVDSRLVGLFARSFQNVTVVDAGPKPYAGPIDAQDVTSALARYLRRSWDSFPVRQQGYLKPDLNRVQDLRNRLADSRPLVGLSWISKNTKAGQFKSARLIDFEPLLRRPGLRFIDLQYGNTTAEREAVERELGVRVERLDDIDNTNDLDGLAALISACDTVLTVSNTTAHLAGAVGARTFVIVPSGRGHLWYWFADRTASPWYPNLHVRRRLRDQSWSDLIAELAPQVVTADKTGEAIRRR